MAEPRADWAIELKKFLEVKIAELFENLAELRGEWKELDAELSGQIKEVRADVKDLGKDARSSNGSRKLEIGLLFALLGDRFLNRRLFQSRYLARVGQSQRRNRAPEKRLGADR